LLDTPGVAFVPVNAPPPPPDGAELVPLPPTFNPAFPVLVWPPEVERPPRVRGFELRPPAAP
jgi:DNA-binding transcriptional LysR family regulator